MCEEQIKEAVARRYAQWLSCLPEERKDDRAGKCIDDEERVFNDGHNSCVGNFKTNAKKLGLIK